MFALKVSPAVMGNVLTEKQIILIVDNVGIYVAIAKYAKILNVLMYYNVVAHVNGYGLIMDGNIVTAYLVSHRQLDIHVQVIMAIAVFVFRHLIWEHSMN